MEQQKFKDISSLQNHLEDKYEGVDFSVLKEREVVHESVELVEVNDKIIVSYLKYDQSPMDYFEDDEGAGEFFKFRSADEVEDKLEELKKEKKLFYLVDKYEHGNVHYSVANTVSYPDDRWDVSHGCAIFVPCSYVQDEYKKMAKKEGVEKAKENFIKDSNAVLSGYSDWCNGEVYGYIVKGLDKKGQEVNCYACWGFVGNDYAQQEKKSIVEYYVNKELEISNQKTKKVKP